VAYLNTVPQNSPGKTEENHEITPTVWLVVQSRFEMIPPESQTAVICYRYCNLLGRFAAVASKVVPFGHVSFSSNSCAVPSAPALVEIKVHFILSPAFVSPLVDEFV
jgi:hypothetical protein